jgi:hypothetical protein
MNLNALLHAHRSFQHGGKGDSAAGAEALMLGKVRGPRLHTRSH